MVGIHLPSVVSPHSPDAFEMSEHPCYHSWNAGYAFEEDESRDPFLLGHDMGFGECVCVCWSCVISGDEIHTPAQEAHGSESCSILPGVCFAVSGSDGEDLFFCVSSRKVLYVRYEYFYYKGW